MNAPSGIGIGGELVDVHDLRAQCDVAAAVLEVACQELAVSVRVEDAGRGRLEDKTGVDVWFCRVLLSGGDETGWNA